MPTFRIDRRLHVAGLLWFLAGLFYFSCETIAALAFRGYSYAHNYISDLGAPVAGVVGGRAVDSPLAWLMNLGGLMLAGALFFSASMLAGWATGAVRSRAGAVLVVLGLMHGAGTALVGAVPEISAASPGVTPPLHGVGAGLAIVGGNLGLVLAGVIGARLGATRAWRIACLALGIFGLVSLALLQFGADAGLSLPKGLLERGSVYPVTVWELMTGLCLLRAARRERSGAARAAA